MTTVVTAYDNLELLINTFSKIGSNPELSAKANTQAMVTAKLPSPLKEAIQELAKLAQIQHPTWLKVVFGLNKEFISIKKPEIALVKGKPSIIIDNHVFDAAPLFKSGLTFIEERGKKQDKNLSYHLTYRGETEGTELLPLKLWTDPEKQLDCIKLKKDPKYFTANVFEYIFPLSTLDSGEYSISKFAKIGKFPVLIINNTQYHAKPKFIDQLSELKLADKELKLIIENETTSKIGDVNVTYKPTYIEGYAPSTSIKKFVTALGLLPTEETLKEKNLVMFDEKIKLELVDITTTTNKNKEGETIKQDAVVVKHEGNQITLTANSPIKRAIENGKFNLSEDTDSYEGYYIIINGVKAGNRGLEFQITFEVPSFEIDKSLSNLADSLGFNL